jgi:hypothetical protein
VSEGPRDDELSPAEARLVRLLALLAPAPPGDPSLTRSVVRVARWQLLFRDFGRAVAVVAAAVADGVAVIAGPGRRGR